MANFDEENVVSNVFGGAEFNDSREEQANAFAKVEFKAEKANNLPTKAGFWAKFKAFWLQEVDWNREIKVELTPYQQKVEDEINEFLHQDVTWKKFHDFLFQEVSFSSKK